MILAPKYGVDILGHRERISYSPPILGRPELSPHFFVSKIEEVIRYYNKFYGNDYATTKAHHRFGSDFYNKYHKVNNRMRQRRFKSGLFRESFKRQSRFYRKRSRYSTRRSSGYSIY